MTPGYLRKALDLIRRRRISYRRAALNPITEEMFKDLAIFCRANETCFTPGDERVSWMLEGRREVWLRIQRYLSLSSEQLLAIHNGGMLPPPEPEEEDENG